MLSGAAAVDTQIGALPGLLAVTLFLWTPLLTSGARHRCNEAEYAAAGVPMPGSGLAAAQVVLASAGAAGRNVTKRSRPSVPGWVSDLLCRWGAYICLSGMAATCGSPGTFIACFWLLIVQLSAVIWSVLASMPSADGDSLLVRFSPGVSCGRPPASGRAPFTGCCGERLPCL